MGLRTNISRRGAVYRFRVRVPIDLVGKIGRREIKRSLRTRDPAIARVLGAILAADVQQLWRRIRQAVDGDEIKRLVTAWLHIELERDLDMRAALAFEPPNPGARYTSVDLLYADAAANLSDWQRIVEQHQWGAARPDVDQLIASHRLAVEFDSPEYRRLCMTMALAQADLHAVRVARSEGRLHTKPDNFESPPTRPAPAPQSAPLEQPGTTLKTAVTRYMAERAATGSLSMKRRHDLLTALDLLMEHLGADRAVGSIGRQDMGSFRELLTKLPPNRRKFFGEMALSQVITEAAARKMAPIAPATILGKYLIPVSGFLDWCQTGGLIETNPAKGVKLATSRAKARRRRGVYEIEQLQVMFSSPLYRGCLSASRVTEAGNYRLRNHKFWLPLLGLYTGARLNELAQLRPKDIREIDGVWCIDITEGDASMSVKTLAGERVVPVHRELARIGFVAFAGEQLQRGEERLFPELTPGAGGYFSDRPSKWYARWLRDTLGAEVVAAANLTFHGFRHTMKDRLRAAGIEEMIQHRIIGHDAGHVSAGYGEGYKPKQLANELNKVGFVGLDLSHLFVSD